MGNSINHKIRERIKRNATKLSHPINRTHRIVTFSWTYFMVHRNSTELIIFIIHQATTIRKLLSIVLSLITRGPGTFKLNWVHLKTKSPFPFSRTLIIFFLGGMNNEFNNANHILINLLFPCDFLQQKNVIALF